MFSKDLFTEEWSEIEAYRAVFRRLAASVVLGAIADLQSSDKNIRLDARLFLEGEGKPMLKALGIRCEMLDDVIEHPPERKALRCSNRRQARAFLYGEQLRKCGAEYQVADH